MKTWTLSGGWALLLCLINGSPLAAQNPTVGYSFFSEDSGGIALAEIDQQDGRILASHVLLDSHECRKPLKVRRALGGRTWIVTNLAKKGPHLFLANVSATSQVTSLELKSVPDDVGVAGSLAIVTGEDDFLAVVDIADRQIVSQRDVSKTFTPPANAPEDVCITPGQRYAVISFQKDSVKGKKEGNRLGIYRLPRMERLVDLPVDRTRPDLHLQNNLKEQGPGPEVIHVCERTDTLLVTLDLYGAVGLIDWSSAREGRLVTWQMLSTSPHQRWGTAFPDRGCPITLGSHEYYLVCNAGAEGGAALVSLAERTVVWRGKTPPGLETPVFFPELKQAFSVCSGKTKRRTPTEITKEFVPKQSLYIFDFSSPAGLQNVSVEAISLNAFTSQIALVSQRPPRLLVATGPTAKVAERLMTYDPISRTILDDQPAAGQIGRLEAN